MFKRKDSNKIWWISYYHQGKEYRESSHSRNEKVAKQLLELRRLEIGADRLGLKAFIGPAQERLTVDQLLDGLVEDYRIRGVLTPYFVGHLKPIRFAFGNLRALDCTETLIDRVISEWLVEGRSPGTINRELQLLGQAFRLAIERKRLSSSPKVRRLEWDNKRQGFFERPEFEAVVKHLPADIQDFTRFAFYSGWRKGEIASLEWEDVDQQGRIIRLKAEHSKNGEPRKVALEGELWEIIQRRRALKEIITEKGVIINRLVFHRNGLPVRDFRKAWASACEAAKVGGRVFHDLRRSAIRNMVRSGTPESVCMRVSGHRSRSVFIRYDITSEDDLRQAAKRLEFYVKSLPSSQSTDG